MYTHERKQYVNFEIFLLEMLKSKYFNIIFIELEHNCLLAVIFLLAYILHLTHVLISYMYLANLTYAATHKLVTKT